MKLKRLILWTLLALSSSTSYSQVKDSPVIFKMPHDSLVVRDTLWVIALICDKNGVPQPRKAMYIKATRKTDALPLQMGFFVVNDRRNKKRPTITEVDVYCVTSFLVYDWRIIEAKRKAKTVKNI